MGHQKEERFPALREYRDLVFLVAFFVHLLVVVVLFGVGFAKYRSYMNQYNPETGPLPGPEAEGSYSWSWSYGGSDSYSYSYSGSDSAGLGGGKFIGSLVFCAGFASIFSIGWLILLRKAAGAIVYISVVCAIVSYIAAAGVWFYLKAIPVAVVFLILALINLLIFFLARHKIEFAKHVLKCVAEVIDNYPAPIWVATVSLLPMVGWCAFWVVTLNFVFYFNSGGAQGICSVYLIFSFYWTTQVIKNTVHVTSSGVFASWYFLAPNMPANPTWESFKRAVTTSFGSICLGSLLVAIVKTLRALLSSRGGILGLILRCFMAIIDRLVQYFNRYAFAQVAIYGKTFCQSAKSTWNMFAEHGFDAVINDDVTGMVLTTGSMVCGLLTAVVGGIFAHIVFKGGVDGLTDVATYSIAAAGFFIGLCVSFITLEVVDSGVATIFVCFVEEPARLRETSPHFYHKFNETFHGKCDLFHHV